MASKRIYFYARCSTLDQTIEQQVAELKKLYPEGTNPKILDEKVSGWKGGKRSQYERLKQDIMDGDVSEVAVFSISRLARNQRECLEFIKLCIDHKVKLTVKTTPLDFTGPLGVALFTFFAAFAQMESDTKSEAIKATLAMQKLEWEKANPGKKHRQHGTAPFTVTSKFVKYHKQVERDHEAGDSIRTICETRGISTNLIQKILKRKGKPIITRQVFSKLYPGWQVWREDDQFPQSEEAVDQRYYEVFGGEPLKEAEGAPEEASQTAPDEEVSDRKEPSNKTAEKNKSAK